jgi:hypothetical protein
MHERIRTLEDARNGLVAPALKEKFGEEMDLFLAMTSANQKSRPSIDEVLRALKHILKLAKTKRISPSLTSTSEKEGAVLSWLSPPASPNPYRRVRQGGKSIPVASIGD